MSDDMRDEVPVPHYENELWHTLAQVHAEQRASGVGADADADLDLDADARLRRRGRRLFFAGVGSIAAAAVALAAIVTTDSEEPPAGTETADSTSPPVAPELSLAAQITAASEEASATSLLHKVTDNQYEADGGTPIGDEEMWTDEQSGAMRSLSYDSDGQPSFDTGRAVAPAVDDPGPPPLPPGASPFDPSLPQERLRQVDHCFAEYREYDQTAIPGHIEADRIGEQLAAGELVEDGTEVVDGRELIRLVQVPVDLVPQGEDEGDTIRPGVTTPPVTDPGETPPPTVDPEELGDLLAETIDDQDQGQGQGQAPETGSLDPDTFEYVEHIYLVDAETHRTVRVIGYPGEAADYSDATYIATIEYLPRTPESLALLSTPLPDGYELVPELRGDGERYDECGW